MKALVAAVAVSLAVAAGQVRAGGMAEPVVEQEIEQGAAAGSRAGILVPVLALLLVGLALSNDDDAGVMVSDTRLKTDILRVGTAANGLPLYRFRYIGSDAVLEGVMAQDVLRHRPEAVVRMPGGFLGVDYGMLGMELRRID